MNRRILLLLTLGAVLAGVAAIWWSRRPSPTAAPPDTPAASGPVSQISSRAEARPPVVFIGLDGADWALLDQYMARGLMPTLRKLVV